MSACPATKTDGASVSVGVFTSGSDLRTSNFGAPDDVEAILYGAEIGEPIESLIDADTPNVEWRLKTG